MALLRRIHGGWPLKAQHCVSISSLFIFSDSRSLQRCTQVTGPRYPGILAGCRWCQGVGCQPEPSSMPYTGQVMMIFGGGLAAAASANSSEP